VLLFGVTPLDIEVARWFYRVDAADHWALARQFPWPLLYGSASWITASLVVIAATALAAGQLLRRRTWRACGTLVLLSLTLGPGLLGNALFKDHWQHPRPRELVEFGGTRHYVPSPLIGSEGGASFPCGHCTVGFLYGAGWWLWKRRRPRWAAASLALGLGLGTLLGVGRMAAGAHFLSDIAWSALLAFAVTHLLYYHVLRLEQVGDGHAATGAEAAPRESRWQRASTIAALLGGVAVLFALGVSPHGTQLSERVPLSTDSPRTLQIEADRADVAIVLVDTPATQLTIDGELHGFGLPTSRLAARLTNVSHPAPALRYTIEARGWLTDVDGVATLTVPAAAFERVDVLVRQGNIRVTDTTRAQVVSTRALQLQLHAGRGRVQLVQRPAAR
jgi:lipid A 4'-phosphatase